LLGRDAILVIGVMRFEGLIFGSTHTDQWTQVINRRSYKFDNPDHKLQDQINAVRLIAPGVEVSGWHLFGHGANFPKDKPDNVLQPADVRSLHNASAARRPPETVTRRRGDSLWMEYREKNSLFLWKTSATSLPP